MILWYLHVKYTNTSYYYSIISLWWVQVYNIINRLVKILNDVLFKKGKSKITFLLMYILQTNEILITL